MGEIALRESEIALIRKSVAKDCNPVEFDQFIHICKHVRLDPLRRQIYAFVFGKKAKNPDNRKLTIVIGIDGYRAISERSGNYRPDGEEPVIEYDNALKGSDNPLGIVKATVRLYKFSHGEWFPVIGVARWDEFAPLKYRDEDLNKIQDGVWEDSGNPRYVTVPKEGARPIVDPDRTGWVKGPINQLVKCAEAQAHRKGWPNDHGGTYVLEEVDRMMTLDLTATEVADHAERVDRVARIGGSNAIIIDWMDGKELDRVPAGQLADRIHAFVRSCSGQPGTVQAWWDRNRHGMRELWAFNATDGLAVKKALEDAVKQPITIDARAMEEQGALI